MRAQRLKSFSDFLKREEIIPHALLVITENYNDDCQRAINELRALNCDLPFYELNISQNPLLKEELAKYGDFDELPTFIYFRGKNVVRKIKGYDQASNFSGLLAGSLPTEI